MSTVLIVEDDPTMRRGLKDNFEMKGYYVLSAADGEEGLETALKEKPDLVILDIMLPEMKGARVKWCANSRDSACLSDSYGMTVR